MYLVNNNSSIVIIIIIINNMSIKIRRTMTSAKQSRIKFKLQKIDEA